MISSTVANGIYAFDLFIEYYKATYTNEEEQEFNYFQVYNTPTIRCEYGEFNFNTVTSHGIEVSTSGGSVAFNLDNASYTNTSCFVDDVSFVPTTKTYVRTPTGTVLDPAVDVMPENWDSPTNPDKYIVVESPTIPITIRIVGVPKAHPTNPYYIKLPWVTQIDVGSDGQNSAWGQAISPSCIWSPYFYDGTASRQYAYKSNIQLFNMVSAPRLPNTRYYGGYFNSVGAAVIHEYCSDSRNGFYDHPGLSVWTAYGCPTVMVCRPKILNNQLGYTTQHTLSDTTNYRFFDKESQYLAEINDPSAYFTRTDDYMQDECSYTYTHDRTIQRPDYELSLSRSGNKWTYAYSYTSETSGNPVDGGGEFDAVVLFSSPATVYSNLPGGQFQSEDAFFDTVFWMYDRDWDCVSHVSSAPDMSTIAKIYRNNTDYRIVYDNMIFTDVAEYLLYMSELSEYLNGLGDAPDVSTYPVKEAINTAFVQYTQSGEAGKAVSIIADNNVIDEQTNAVGFNDIGNKLGLTINKYPLHDYQHAHLFLRNVSGFSYNNQKSFKSVALTYGGSYSVYGGEDGTSGMLTEVDISLSKSEYSLDFSTAGALSFIDSHMPEYLVMKSHNVEIGKDVSGPKRKAFGYSYGLSRYYDGIDTHTYDTRANEDRQEVRGTADEYTDATVIIATAPYIAQEYDSNGGVTAQDTHPADIVIGGAIDRTYINQNIEQTNTLGKNIYGLVGPPGGAPPAYEDIKPEVTSWSEGSVGDEHYPFGGLYPGYVEAGESGTLSVTYMDSRVISADTAEGMHSVSAEFTYNTTCNVANRTITDWFGNITEYAETVTYETLYEIFFNSLNTVTFPDAIKHSDVIWDPYTETETTSNYVVSGIGDKIKALMGLEAPEDVYGKLSENIGKINPIPGVTDNLEPYITSPTAYCDGVKTLRLSSTYINNNWDMEFN